MSSLVLNITFDCLDARSVAQFWEAVTGHPSELQHQPGNDYWVVGPPDGSLPRLLFVTVPEKKATKNRVHWTCCRGTRRARKKRSPASSVSAPASSTTVADPVLGAGS